jgi:hypothetical protein
MNPGPLRRMVGLLGLLALIPIAVLLLTGALDLVTAASRALIVLLVVVVVGRLTGSFLQSIAGQLDEQDDAVSSRVSGSNVEPEPGAHPR